MKTAIIENIEKATIFPTSGIWSNIKKATAFLFLAAMMTTIAPAQPVYISVGSYKGDPSGEQAGRFMWLKLNFDLWYLYDAITNMQAKVAALQAVTVSTNPALISTTVTLLDTNPFVFGTSNYLGNFTNIFTLTSVAGTNSLTNYMSTDGGSTWLSFYQTNPITPLVFTNYFTNQLVTNILWTTNVGGTNYTLSSLGTNFTTVTNIYTNLISGGVKLAVLSSGSVTGAVTVTALSNPALQGRHITFAGETVDFTSATVTGLGITTNFQLTSTTTNTLYFTNGLLQRFTTP